MPSKTQIVPKYLHSHVETIINDNTEFTESTSQPVDSNARFISVFTSDKGIDNKLIKFTTLQDFVNTYGQSNYAKHGQALMMPMALLNSGYATVYAMRVMPHDAFAANSVLYLYYKMTTDNNSSPVFKIRFGASTISKSEFSGASSYSNNDILKESLRLKVESRKTDADANGVPAAITYTGEEAYLNDDNLSGDTAYWRRVPIAIFTMNGKGTYGNYYRWRIVRDKKYEKNYGIKIFNFECIDTSNGVNVEQTYSGAMVTSPKFNNITLINDIIENEDPGVVHMDVYSFEDNVEEVYQAYRYWIGSIGGTVEYNDINLPDGFPESADEFDIFFGRKVLSDEFQPNLDIIEEGNRTSDDDNKSITVDRVNGIPLSSGTDGSFDTSIDYPDINNPTIIHKGVDYAKEVRNELFIEAFSGELDSTILSTRRIPCRAIFDANYDPSVKYAIYDLITHRGDCIFYLDTGINTNVADIDDIIEQYKGFNSRLCSKNWNWYYARDYVTKKKIPVTITYFLAQRLPRHLVVEGGHIPFVKAVSQLSGHIKNTLYPIIDDIDMEIKEKLYEARINYYEVLAENVFQRCCQNTAQTINSDLLEENNMHTLLEIKRILEIDCFNNLYNFTSASERNNFAEYEKAKFADWIGRKVQSFNVRFDVNEWEMERSIIHCYAEVQFRNLVKRTIIEIDVNKRDFLA